MEKNKWELFHRLVSSEQYHMMRETFLSAWGRNLIWLELEEAPDVVEQLQEKVKAKHPAYKIKKNRGVLEKIHKVLSREKTYPKGFVTIKGKMKTRACIMALKSENYIFGYIILLGLKTGISNDSINILRNYLNLLTLKVQDDMELARLYETIQPRTAALSTIHTIHRLISSSLNLKELLPRIAKLTLQVMRVKKCAIYLLDKSGRYLKPAAVATEKGFIKDKEKISINRDKFVGQAAKTAVPVLIDKSLALPLIEEDVLGVIVVTDKQDNKPFNYFDQEILTTLSEQAVIAIKNARLHKKQEKIAKGSIKALSSIKEATTAHPHISESKFRKLVNAIAQELNLPRKKINSLNYAARLHDVGRLGIPEEILKKQEPLTSKELKMIKEQPTKSAAILKHLNILEPAIPVILSYREKFDGSGYPEGLRGKDIPIGARILSVVDAFEAMITKRPYRRSKSVDQAIREIKKNSGSQFDPRVVDAFIKVVEKSKGLKESLKEAALESKSNQAKNAAKSKTGHKKLSKQKKKHRKKKH